MPQLVLALNAIGGAIALKRIGHVFDDGPLPRGKRYYLNGDVLKSVSDPLAKGE